MARKNRSRCAALTAAALLVLSCLTLAPAASAALTQVAERQLVNQSAEEIEPALITYTHFGVEYSASVWMNFDPNINTNSTLKYTAWTSSGNANTSSIPAVSGYTRYADPVLVKHPTLARIFLVALALNQTATQINSAIVVWYSANGGWNWSPPTILASATRSNGSGFILDKPAAATAPDGKLWVAYLRSAASASLHVQHGTLAGSPAAWTWSQARLLPLLSPTGPQIMIDSMVGSKYDVYVLDTYSHFGLELIRGTYDPGNAANPLSFPNAAQHWQPSQSKLYVGGSIAVKPGVNLRAESVPVAKLDRTRRRIAVAWHEEYGANRSSTRLQFAVYRIDANAWTNVTFAATNGHDINVGMDFDANGNYLVTWFRFPYQQSVYYSIGKYVTIDANGSPSWTADELITNRAGDVALLTTDTRGVRHLGEYHDVSYTNGTFKAVHPIIVSPWGDPWAFTVRP